MLKKTITYTDFFGEERTEDFYFNISESELIEMETSWQMGLSTMLKMIINAKDQPAIMKAFKDIILNAYGEKSQDGRRFMKSKEISTAFSQTEAFNILFIELISDEKYAGDFINGIMPSKAKMEAVTKKLTKELN